MGGAAKSYQEARKSPWAERLARFGLAAKGIVYTVIAVLAIQLARGERGRAEGARGALQSIAQQPFGSALLAIVGFGLLGYVLWRLVQAISDPDRKGSGAKGLAERGGYLLSAVIYGGVAFFALNLLFGSGGGGGGGQSPQTWTARLLSMPLGQWWVYAVAAAVAFYGFKQIHTAYKQKFTRELAMSEMSAAERRWAVRLGKLGFAARGLVFLVMGAYLMRAAAQSDASEARGLDGALNSLARQPYGPWLLGFVAAGLLAYGLFLILEARFRRIAT